MKKIYQSPQTEILKIAAVKMVCASEVLTKGGDTDSGGITDADSRIYDYNNVWDDNEEEEEDF